MAKTPKTQERKIKEEAEEGVKHTVCNLCTVTCHYNCALEYTSEGDKFSNCNISFDFDSKTKTDKCNVCGCKTNMHTHAKHSYEV